MPDFSSVMHDMLAVLDESDALFLQGYDHPHSIVHKGALDLVTETDLAIEAFLKEKLKDLVPGAVFMAEESNVLHLPEDVCWIIDPIDGTTNFAHHFGDTATSIALWDHGKILLGAVSAPVRRERYVAERGKGAWLNGKRLYVSHTASCNEALVATGFPYTVREDMDAVLQDMRILLNTTIGVRRCGSAALDLCFVACGSFDAYFEASIKPWDVAAGWLIVEEAGGLVTDRCGSPYTFHHPILASNGILHQQMVKNLQCE